MPGCWKRECNWKLIFILKEEPEITKYHLIKCCATVEFWAACYSSFWHRQNALRFNKTHRFRGDKFVRSNSNTWLWLKSAAAQSLSSSVCSQITLFMGESFKLKRKERLSATEHWSASAKLFLWEKSATSAKIYAEAAAPLWEPARLTSIFPLV